MELDTYKLSDVKQGDENCRKVDIQGETESETKTTVSPSAKTMRWDEEGGAPRAMVDAPSHEDEASSAPSPSEEEVNKDISQLKSESQSKKDFPYLLNEEEMEDAEYVVLIEGRNGC